MAVEAVRGDITTLADPSVVKNLVDERLIK